MDFICLTKNDKKNFVINIAPFFGLKGTYHEYIIFSCLR